MWAELVKKIELQSILVLFITLAFGAGLLYKYNNISTPAGILGCISVIIGLLYTFGSFFTNQTRESYKDVISEYKAMIASLKSASKHVQGQYKQTLNDTVSNKEVGPNGYSIIQDSEIGTEKE